MTAAMPEPDVDVDGSTEGDVAEPTTETSPSGHRRLVLGARTALVMILVAAVVILGLGLVSLVLVDPPEADGWLRSVFGTVFGYMALAIATVLGVPSAVGVWAMAGATASGATPALPRTVRRLVAIAAAAVVVMVAAVVLTGGRGPTLLDLGAIGLVALLILGLAGSVAFSPHRGRAILAGLASALVSIGVLWFVAAATGGTLPVPG
jgi:hypothetical protein